MGKGREEKGFNEGQLIVWLLSRGNPIKIFSFIKTALPISPRCLYKSVRDIQRRRGIWVIHFSGQLRVKEDGEGKHALLKADGQYELDTLSKGGKDDKDGEKEFQARNDRFDFRLTPAEQNEKQGHGLLSFGDNVSERRIWFFRLKMKNFKDKFWVLTSEAQPWGKYRSDTSNKPKLTCVYLFLRLFKRQR